MSTAGFHITEDCAEVYLRNESGMEFFQLARRLHDYLRQGQRLPARSLFEATDGCKEISHEAFDALAKRRMENAGEISGLFELDFDARTFSALNIMDGWRSTRCRMWRTRQRRPSLNAKKAETSKRNLGFLRILHRLFHCGALLLFLLRQKQLNLLLHTLELLIFGIRERRVILQRKRTRVPDHSKLLV